MARTNTKIRVVEILKKNEEFPSNKHQNACIESAMRYDDNINSQSNSKMWNLFSTLWMEFL